MMTQKFDSVLIMRCHYDYDCFLGTTNQNVSLDLNGKNQTVAAITAATQGVGTAYIQNNSGAGCQCLPLRMEQALFQVERVQP